MAFNVVSRYGRGARRKVSMSRGVLVSHAGRQVHGGEN
jgi:hypothetical protein